jgi:HEAT repeat protein
MSRMNLNHLYLVCLLGSLLFYGGCSKPNITEELLSFDPYTQHKALKKLEEFNSAQKKAHIADLIEGLHHEDSQVVHRAVEALVVIGQDAVNPLIKELESTDPFVRLSAAETLGRIGPPAEASVPSLVPRLEDHHPLVREEAVVALARIQSRPDVVIPALEKALQDEDDMVRSEAEKALKLFNKNLRLTS